MTSLLPSRPVCSDPKVTRKPPMVVRCPTCGKPVPWTSESRWRPFCSRRCRLIDLGEWLTDPEETSPPRH